MILTKRVDLGEYVVIIEYDDNGSGHIKVSILDELEDEVDFIEIINDEEENNETDPTLN